MKNDADDLLASSLPRSRPLAKDLLSLPGVLNVTAEMMRNLLESRANDELMASYGAWPSEALASLNYADLASLPIWDEDILLEVAGAPNPKELAALSVRESNAKRDIDREMWAHEITVKTEATSRIMRRIRLAKQAEARQEVMPPAEGVLLLRRAGFDVAYELVEAVAAIVLHDDTDEAVWSFRELMRISNSKDLTAEPPPRTEIGGEVVEATPAPASESVPTNFIIAKAQTHKIRTREAAILSAEINQAKLAAQDPASPMCVWDELTKLAEQKLGPMVGFSSDGIQYRGKQYQATQVPDVFTFKHLRDRMKRAETRYGAPSRA